MAKKNSLQYSKKTLKFKTQMGICQTNSTDNQTKESNKICIKTPKISKFWVAYCKKKKKKNYSLQYWKSVDLAEVRGERRHRKKRRVTKSFIATIAID